MLRSRARPVGLGLALLFVPAGCSQLVARGNAGIPHLERASAPVRGVALGAKYAGWVLGAPLALALAPLAALGWATPWVDLPLAVDLASAPAVGLGYGLQALLGYPTWGALGWAGEPLAADQEAGPVPPGFVVSHRLATRPSRAARLLPPVEAARWAPDADQAAHLRGEVARAWEALGERAGPLELPLPDHGPFQAALELYPAAPRGAGPRPLLLITPPTQAAFAARWLGARYARRGVHVAVVQPRGLFLAPELDPAQVEEKLRGAVVCAREVLAALRALPAVEATRCTYLGVSAGGIFGAVLLAVEPGIARAALVFPGGDLPAIVCESDEEHVTAYREAWAARGLAPAALREALRAAIETEPLRLAPSVEPGRVLLFLGDRDTKVPVAQGEALRLALGEPETWRLAGNHDTAALCFGFVLSEVDRFLFPPPLSAQ